jgi:cyclophilin family peptidyl-prolyl cis-trans isomerase
MWDRARDGNVRKSPRRGRAPRFDSLEGRQLLASLAPISNVTVPVTLGYQVPLNGSGTTDPQSFTVTSSNPDIGAAVAQGVFLTMNISHLGTTSGDPTFSGVVTFELFGDLTPTAVKQFQQYVQSGFFSTSTGPQAPIPKTFFRVASGFPTSTDFIMQGGAINNGNSALGPEKSGQPNTPFIDEFNTQLAFTGKEQLAMANSGPDTNDT